MKTGTDVSALVESLAELLGEPDGAETLSQMKAHATE